MTVRAETTGVGLKFRGGRPIFSSKLEKKSRLHGRGCIFSRSPIVQVVGFSGWFFGAVLIVSAGHLVLPSPRPAFEDMAVMEEAVRMIPTAL